MNIKIIKDETMPSDLTGGEYSTADIGIFIDPSLPIRTLRLLVIHAVLENYCPSWEHSKIEELVAYIEEGLDMLEVNSKP